MEKLNDATQKLLNSYGLDETIDLVKNSKRMAEEALEDYEKAGFLCNEQLEEEIDFHQGQLEILYTLKRG